MPSLALRSSLVALGLFGAACSSEAPAPGVPAPATSAGAGGMISGGSGGSATTPGGAAGQAATGGATVSAGAGGGSGAGAGGGGGAAGAAGNGGSGGAVDLDPVAPRPLAVDPNTACNCELDFTAIELDPLADSSTSPTHAGDTQHMKVDPTKPMQGKLAIVLG